MDLRLLKYFAAVYEERNVTKAAARCFVSQPSLSNAIRQLEQELDTKLFERGSKGMEVTDAAVHLYPRAKRLLDESDDLASMFRPDDSGDTLVLGTFPDLSPKQMQGFLNKIRTSLPELTVRLVDHDAISDAKLTIDVLKKDDDLFQPVWEEDYVLCVRKDHPLAKKKTVVPEDLHGQRFIECPPCEAHHQTIGLLAATAHQMEIVARADHKPQVMHLVQAGFGISFLPTGVLEFATDLTTVPFEGPRMFRAIGLAYAASRCNSPILKQVVELFQ